MYIITCIKKESVYIGALGDAEIVVGALSGCRLRRNGGFAEIAIFWLWIEDIWYKNPLFLGAEYMWFLKERKFWERGNKSYRNQHVSLQYFVMGFGFGCKCFLSLASTTASQGVNIPSWSCTSSSINRKPQNALRPPPTPPRNAARWRENGQKDVAHHLHLWYPELSPSTAEKPRTKEVETCLRTKSIYNVIL